jgi:hypothetical protein
MLFHSTLRFRLSWKYHLAGGNKKIIKAEGERNKERKDEIKEAGSKCRRKE